MNPLMGQRWQPGAQQDNGGIPLNKPSQTPAAEPSQLLTLRLPNRTVPSAPAPLSLLMSHGSGALGGTNFNTFLTMLGHLMNNPTAPQGGYAGLPNGGAGATSDQGGQSPVSNTLRINVPGLHPGGDNNGFTTPVPKFRFGQNPDQTLASIHQLTRTPEPGIAPRGGPQPLF